MSALTSTTRLTPAAAAAATIVQFVPPFIFVCHASSTNGKGGVPMQTTTALALGKEAGPSEEKDEEEEDESLLGFDPSLAARIARSK